MTGLAAGTARSWRVAELGLIMVLLGLLYAKPVTDTDISLHLGMGRAFAVAGVPAADIFSWTAAGTPWTPHEWLYSLLLWRITDLLHIIVLPVIPFLAWTALLALLYFSAARLERTANYALLWLLAVLAGWHLWVLRPHLIFVFGLLTIAVGNRVLARRPLGIAVLALFFAIWANMHASVLLGLVVWAWLRWWRHRELPIGDWSWRREALTLLTLALATLVNPAGARLWLWPLSLLGGGKQGFVEEWGGFAAVAGTLPGLAFIVLTTAVTCLLVRAARRGERLPWGEAGLWLVFTLWALASRRMVAPAVCFAIILAGRPALRAAWTGRRGLLALLIVVELLGTIYELRLPEPRINIETMSSMSKMVLAQIRRNPPAGGRLFHPYEWGGAVMLHGWPELKTFVDGRTEVFSSQLLGDYGILFQAGDGWRELLDRYAITAAWLPESAPLARRLLADPAWQRDGAVGSGMVYLTRKGTDGNG